MRSKRLGAPPDRPLLNGPFATIEAVRGARLLASLCPLAQAAGLRVGQKLADARAICPALEVADADPAADRLALDELAQSAERYTPLAMADAPDGLWLDITGCAHLFGTETDMAGDVQRWLARDGIESRLAVAGTTGAAWALARSLVECSPASVPSRQEKQALAMLPVMCLRLEPRIVAGLRRLGLRTVGELAGVPRAELSARFGAMPSLRLDHAFGDAAEALAWPHLPAAWTERLAFAEPIATADDLGRALDLLAGRLCTRLAAERRGGQSFCATFYRVDGARPAIEVRTSQPVRDRAYLGKLLKAALDTVDPGFGVDAMVLDAGEVNAFDERQAGLSAVADDAEAGRLAAVLDQLVNRLGADRVWRVTPFPSHVPERVTQRTCAVQASSWQRDLASVRPVRLLRRPEAIEATAPVPDDPPILFRWRGSLHRVRAAAGPERIAREWWLGEAGGNRPSLQDNKRIESDRVRDYYRVEDSGGARYWIFRVGLLGDGQAARWFLHGLFG